MEVAIEVKISVDGAVKLEHQIKIEDGTEAVMQNLALDAVSLLNQECVEAIKTAIPVA